MEPDFVKDFSAVLLLFEAIKYCTENLEDNALKCRSENLKFFKQI